MVEHEILYKMFSTQDTEPMILEKQVADYLRTFKKKDVEAITVLTYLITNKELYIEYVAIVDGKEYYIYARSNNMKRVATSGDEEIEIVYADVDLSFVDVETREETEIIRMPTIELEYHVEIYRMMVESIEQIFKKNYPEYLEGNVSIEVPNNDWEKGWILDVDTGEKVVEFFVLEYEYVFSGTDVYLYTKIEL